MAAPPALSIEELKNLEGLDAALNKAQVTIQKSITYFKDASARQAKAQSSYDNINAKFKEAMKQRDALAKEVQQTQAKVDELVSHNSHALGFPIYAARVKGLARDAIRRQSEHMERMLTMGDNVRSAKWILERCKETTREMKLLRGSIESKLCWNTSTDTVQQLLDLITTLNQMKN